MNLFDYHQKMWPIAFLALITCVLACSKDDAGPFPSVNQVTQGCPISMSYEITTAAFTRAANLNEQTELTTAEQILSYPTFSKCSVDMCIAENGEMSADIQMLESENTPNYPVGTVGLQSIPEEFQVDRIEINGGTTIYYNDQGEAINTEVIDDASSVEFYAKIIEEMADVVPLTEEQMSWVIEGFIGAGFDMTPINENLEMLTQPHPDGSYSKVVLDKNLQVIRGQANYDSSGKLLTKSNFSFTGEPGSPIVTGHRFVTYFISPYSQKRMAITRKSKIENFSLTKN